MITVDQHAPWWVPYATSTTIAVWTALAIGSVALATHSGYRAAIAYSFVGLSIGSGLALFLGGNFAAVIFLSTPALLCLLRLQSSLRRRNASLFTLPGDHRHDCPQRPDNDPRNQP